MGSKTEARRNALGAGAPVVLNGANEVAVSLFLDRRLGFLDIAAVVEEALGLFGTRAVGGLDDVLALDAEARREAAGLAARRAAGKPPQLVNKTPWEEIQRGMVGQLGTGACLEPATLYLNILETRGESRHNH